MKKLLFVPIIAMLSWLGSCAFTPKVPTPTEIIKQAHEAIPSVPQITIPNQVKPHAPAKPVRRHKPSRPQARPVPDQAPVETLPPQQGPICIFPFNMIPNCTPEPPGRLP